MECCCHSHMFPEKFLPRPGCQGWCGNVDKAPGPHWKLCGSVPPPTETARVHSGKDSMLSFNTAWWKEFMSSIHSSTGCSCWCCMKLKNRAEKLLRNVWRRHASCHGCTAPGKQCIQKNLCQGPQRPIDLHLAPNIELCDNCTNKSGMVPRAAMPHLINHGAPKIPPTFMGCETASMATTLDNLLKSIWFNQFLLKLKYSKKFLSKKLCQRF